MSPAIPPSCLSLQWGAPCPPLLSNSLPGCRERLRNRLLVFPCRSSKPTKPLEMALEKERKRGLPSFWGVPLCSPSERLSPFSPGEPKRQNQTPKCPSQDSGS